MQLAVKKQVNYHSAIPARGETKSSFESFLCVLRTKIVNKHNHTKSRTEISSGSLVSRN